MPSARFVDRWVRRDREGLGCCASMTRNLLFLVNLLFFVFGVVVFAATAVLKWGNTSFSDFQDDSLNDIIETGRIKNVANILLVLGSIITVIGMFGMCGTKRLSKPFLVRI